MAQHSEISVYTRENLVKDEAGALGLAIQLQDEPHTLPLINIGEPTAPVYIAILNPNNPEIAKVGSEIIAQYLQDLSVHLVITAPSSKSTAMVQRANELAELPKPPIQLLGGSTVVRGEKHFFTESEVVELGTVDTQPPKVVECRPITLSPDQPSKFFALTTTMEEKILSVARAGGKIAIVDDVYSSGATITAIQELLHRALGQESADIVTIVVARELAETSPFFAYPEALETDSQALNLYAAILIPVLFLSEEDIKQIPQQGTR